MVKLLAQFILSLLKKSTDGSAKTTRTGISGKIGLLIRILTLIPAGLLIAFASLAIKDPEPEDRMASYLVIVITGHSFSFSCLSSLTYFHQQSSVWPERRCTSVVFIVLVFSMIGLDFWDRGRLSVVRQHDAGEHVSPFHGRRDRGHLRRSGAA